MSATDRPNVILICVDQWRGDCLSIDGHPVVHTPYLDELAPPAPTAQGWSPFRLSPGSLFVYH